MKNKIYYGIITLILCISIISMSTISLYAASYNKRAQVIGSYLSVYAYSYWYNISVQHNNGTITYANDISLYGSNCQHYALQYGCTISPSQSSKLVHSANNAITYNINVAVYANTALSTPVYVGSLTNTITAVPTRARSLENNKSINPDEWIVYYEQGNELFFDIQEATKFAAENGLSLIYVMQKSEELRNNEHLNIVYQ